jgi:hypothetical protein
MTTESDSPDDLSFGLGLDEPPQPQKEAAAQPYRALARKYRPQSFDELIGQDAMVQTLGNAIRRDRLAHAFLMTGVRGVGKTSTARLIAKALNCIGPDGKGGPTISPWHTAALSWKLLTDLTPTLGIEEAAFIRPSEVEWHNRVCAGDRLRIEIELVELLEPHPLFREEGWAKIRVELISTGAAGLGAWADDDQELVDDTALTYFAQLKARRARRAEAVAHAG